jgi:molybdate-binding protein
MAPAEGIALVRDGRCHAAAVAGGTRTQPVERTNGSLVTARLAECEVALAFAGDRHRRAAPTELLRSGIRLVAGPRGAPARRVFEDAARETGVCVRDIAEVRSDAAALATVACGYADVAVSALPVARRVGLTTITLGQAALDLVINRGVAERDQLLRALLDAMSSRSLAAALKGAGYGPVGVVRLSVDRSTALKSRVVKELRRKRAHSSLEATR